MEDAAALQVELFQELADGAPVMLWRIDAAFEQDWANQCWFDFTGGSLEEERGFGWVKRIHPDDSDRVLEEFGRAFEAREAVTVEFRLRRRDGRYRWLLDSGSPLFRDGEFAGFVGSCIDITERKETELRAEALQEELIRLSRAEAVNLMASGVVHELGQPLQAISCSAAVVERLLAGKDDLPPEALEGAKTIRDAVERAGSIVRNCRSLAGGPRSERIRADLGATLLAAEPLLRAHSHARDVLIQWNLSYTLEAEISVVGIQQVLMNLASNAFEAMSAAPVRRLSIEASPWGTLAIVSVADTGPGIPRTLRKRIFDPLVSTRAEGMGIGLYVCRSIIKAHGGRIWAEAASSGGAVFKFTLPLAP